jgi:hypothetical protein
MNKLIAILALALSALTITSFVKPPKKATVTFKASGTCKMCKERIESAVDKPGIYKATYNPESQMLTVSYNSKKIEVIQLHNLVAIAGHDTEMVKASEQAYQSLPECCKYRDGAKCDH